MVPLMVTYSVDIFMNIVGVDHYKIPDPYHFFTETDKKKVYYFRST